MLNGGEGEDNKLRLAIMKPCCRYISSEKGEEKKTAGVFDLAKNSNLMMSPPATVVYPDIPSQMALLKMRKKLACAF